MIYRELANPLVDLHRRLLQDSVRVKSFGRAIRETVKEGDIVLDIGTGTGIMAMLAAKAGAKKVYAIERTSAIEFGKELARENGLLGSIEFIKGDVVDAGQLEKADVIISECLESPGPSGMMVSVLNARNRWLKSRGRIIPESFRTFFVPVQSETLYREANMPYYRGLDLSVLQDVACNLAFVADLRKGDFLSSAKSLPMFSLRASNKVSISGTLNFRVNANCLERFD